MKKEYNAPELEITTFDTEDIITLSTGTDLSNGTGYNDIWNE